MFAQCIPTDNRFQPCLKKERNKEKKSRNKRRRWMRLNFARNKCEEKKCKVKLCVRMRVASVNNHAMTRVVRVKCSCIDFWYWHRIRSASHTRPALPTVLIELWGGWASELVWLNTTMTKGKVQLFRESNINPSERSQLLQFINISQLILFNWLIMYYYNCIASNDIYTIMKY
jgi:hypothetical protein